MLHLWGERARLFLWDPNVFVPATSTKELRGWYAYAFAAETYVICGEYYPVHKTS